MNDLGQAAAILAVAIARVDDLARSARSIHDAAMEAAASVRPAGDVYMGRLYGAATIATDLAELLDAISVQMLDHQSQLYS